MPTTRKRASPRWSSSGSRASIDRAIEPLPESSRATWVLQTSKAWLPGPKLRAHVVHAGTLFVALGHSLATPCIELPDLLVVELQAVTHRHDAFDIYSAAGSAPTFFVLTIRVRRANGERREQSQAQDLIALHGSKLLRTN